uniref:G-type lectin S-receptor-like serine/threonine-protein kinase At1g34300 n=1 Tax=Erigeron canadensis TaxID=72917 RepID=UPI001CB8E428|nr:G-type lectin S-receptor-like serine/threonine-protein kinase At1g34300 [Erigeron canadensis]
MSNAAVGVIVVAIIAFITVLICGLMCNLSSFKKKKKEPLDNDSWFIPLAMVQFLDDMEREKPIQFTSHHLRIATDNFTIKLGSGGFGTVYKGIISNNTPVAVKVLNGTSDKSIEQQFMAEMSTMGRTHHFNLIRLYGFCFESSLRALVYEFMVNGSLDHYLFKEDKKTIIGFKQLHEIALGSARGITYLHEQCHQRIVHYDIKPANILLDSNYCAKVADFGLAKLCNRDNTHITMTARRGTPGYAAPELWMPFPVTHKCDVYSFGMLLFEIIGRRNNMDMTFGDSQQWFPVWAWGKYENKQLKDLMIACGIAKEDEEVVERMLKVAFCCVQYRPETRPMMSIVVKMLEGGLEIPDPLNPFAHLFSGASEAGDSLAQIAWNVGGLDWSSSKAVSKSTILMETPIMKKYEITIASV